MSRVLCSQPDSFHLGAAPFSFSSLSIFSPPRNEMKGRKKKRKHVNSRKATSTLLVGRVRFSLEFSFCNGEN